MTFCIANAPVSYGAFEETVGVLPNVPGPDELLAAIAAAGYEGTELGPLGYLGDGAELRARLERHGLVLTGGYVPLRFAEPEPAGEDLAALARTLDAFEAAGAADARPVLADAGSAARRAQFGRAAPGLDGESAARLAAGVMRAAGLARSRGFEPAFHHHAGTFVETPAEIDALLDATDVGLLLDTGHLLVGGGEPIEALGRWASRIDYVHVKDVRGDVLRQALADGADMGEAWRRGIFCELGRGDVDLHGFFRRLDELGYAGWVVVEQDRVPREGEPLADAAGAQARNRRWLADELGV